MCAAGPVSRVEPEVIIDIQPDRQLEREGGYRQK